jgi:hypothetical protein
MILFLHGGDVVHDKSLSMPEIITGHQSRLILFFPEDQVSSDMTGIMWPPMAPVLAKKSGSMRAEPALDSTRVVPFEDGPKRSA